MSLAHYPLVPATLAFGPEGVPVSPQYGDVYHAPVGAIRQAEGIFLRGNGLPERWQGKSSFTVCESGFGQGASFLACWDAWRRDPKRSERLHFISFEAQPFSSEDLATLHARLPQAVQDLAAELRAQWPLLIPGIHRLDLAQGQVSLTLLFGPITHFVRELDACVDAFFLDGFAPSVNPDMWHVSLFKQFVRLSAPGATAATWCSAGQVRRDLETAGFLVKKVPGFGGKREMTVARLREHLGRFKALHAVGEQTAIIGGGLAGASAAFALSLRGQNVQVYDPAFVHGPQTTHVGHRWAALSPVFALDDAPIARLSRAGLFRARQRWSRLPGQAKPLVCGTLIQGPGGNEAERIQQAIRDCQFPQQWVRWLGAAEMPAGQSQVYEGLYFPMGMLIQPAELLRAMYDTPLIERHAKQVCKIRQMANGAYQLLDQQGRELTRVEHVLIATAGKIPELVAELTDLSTLPRLQGVRHLAGQVSYVSQAQGLADFPLIVSGNGYVLPAQDGLQVLGSTYQEEGEAVCTLAGHVENQSKARSMFMHAQSLWQQAATFGGWAGWRASMCDHLPVAGALPGHPQVCLSGAFGSRGLSWSMLLADYYAARQLGEPSPLERRIEVALFPR